MAPFLLGRPRDIALVYKYDWENGGEADLAFLCDPSGNVYAVQVVRSNAILPPYTVANTSISILGNFLLEGFKNQMTPAQVQQARQFIDNPNARGLLEMELKLQQAFGR
jgi:hypothetical protein